MSYELQATSDELRATSEEGQVELCLHSYGAPSHRACAPLATPKRSVTLTSYHS